MPRALEDFSEIDGAIGACSLAEIDQSSARIIVGKNNRSAVIDDQLPVIDLDST
ncbi:MAG: hypothetical protein QM811_19020 [Pirellulales bacterium]